MWMEKFSGQRVYCKIRAQLGFPPIEIHADLQKVYGNGAVKYATVCKWVRRFNPFPNKPWFLRVCSTRLLKTLWEKEKLLVTSNFSFSHSVFYPIFELSTIFIKFKIVVCKPFEFGRV